MIDKIVIVGDVHGRNFWKQVVEKEGVNLYTLFVYLGDYWDSFDKPYIEQESNFLDILQFKKDNMHNVILLIGNHDYVIPGNWSGKQQMQGLFIEEYMRQSKENGMKNPWIIMKKPPTIEVR